MPARVGLTYQHWRIDIEAVRVDVFCACEVVVAVLGDEFVAADGDNVELILTIAIVPVSAGVLGHRLPFLIELHREWWKVLETETRKLGGVAEVDALIRP